MNNSLLHLEAAPNRSSLENTRCVQAAIDELGERGGGTVCVGAGFWRVTTLFLRSGVRLHLQQGAVLQAETDLSLYPPLQSPDFAGEERRFHLIYARDCDDIALEGDGTIEGEGHSFWTRARTEAERPYGIFDYFVTGERISPLVQIVGCRRVRVENLTLQNSPGWTLHCFDCEEVRVRGVRIRNDLMGPNTDGITINGCRNVFVSECDVVTGDDAIGIKASNPDAACRRVVVSDCIVQTNCGAFILGAETLGGIYDVTFSNCIASASLRLACVEMWDAGHVENVIWNNVMGHTFPQEGVTCERPLYLDIQQHKREEKTLGSIRNIVFSNVVCTTRGRLVFTAQDGACIENVTLRDIHLRIPEVEDPDRVVPAAPSMQNSNFNPLTRAARAAVVADNVRGLALYNLNVDWPEFPVVPMHALCLRRVEALEVHSPRLCASSPDVNYQQEIG